jgi:DNA-directed RNA polymerase specialized sigma24 family protein
MSKMSDLSYDIEQLYIDGLTARQIAAELECPLEIVLAALEEINVECDEEVSDYGFIDVGGMTYDEVRYNARGE